MTNGISNSERLLKSKINKWRLVCIIWNVFIIDKIRHSPHKGLEQGWFGREPYVLTTIYMYIVQLYEMQVHIIQI